MNEGLIIVLAAGVQALLLFIFKTTYAGAVKSKFDESLESVKSGFTKDVEKLKSDLALNVNTEVAKVQASLSKINISHQIVTSEYTKYKFDKITSLNKALLELLKQHSDVHVLFRKTIKSSDEVDAALNGFIPVRAKITFISTETSLFIDEDLDTELTQYNKLSQSVINHLIALGSNQLKIYQLGEENSSLNQDTLKELREELDVNLNKLDELRGKLRDGFASIRIKLKAELKKF